MPFRLEPGWQKKGRRKAREAFVSVYTFLFGGSGLLFFTGHPALAAACFAIYLLALFEVPAFLRWLLWVRRRAGLTQVIPIGPTDPARRSIPEEAKRHARVAIATLQRALEPSNEVRLLLASGFRVVGWDRHKGWLYDAIEEAPSRRIKVLLLDPNCQAAEARAADVLNPYGHEKYAAGTMAVLSTLQHWKDNLDIPLEVKLYTEPPIWQMIILDRELWLMSAGQLPSDHSPLYVFQRGREFGLSWGLEAVFDRRWTLPTTHGVDWSTVSRPPAEEVLSVQGIDWH